MNYIIEENYLERIINIVVIISHEKFIIIYFYAQNSIFQFSELLIVDTGEKILRNITYMPRKFYYSISLYLEHPRSLTTCNA